MMKTILHALGIRRVGIVGPFFRNVVYTIIDLIGGVFFMPLALARRRRTVVKKILLIRLDRIGDMVLTTPAIRAVREGYPGATIDILIREYTRDILISNPALNRILTIEHDTVDTDYDIALAFVPDFYTNYLTYVSGAWKRIGYTGRGGGFFLTDKIKDDRATRIRHEVVSALEIAQLAGGHTANTALEVSTTPGGEAFAAQRIESLHLPASTPLIGIHPGSRQSYIRWSAQHYAALADRFIRERRAAVILFGGRAEAPLIAQVVSYMKETPIVITDATLTQLISLIKRCSLFVSNSTGPMHIAAGVGTPVVAIFGCKHPLDSHLEWAPWCDTKRIVMKDPGCAYCHPSDCRDFACMSILSPDDVMHAAQELLQINSIDEGKRISP